MHTLTLILLFVAAAILPIVLSLIVEGLRKAPQTPS